MAARSDNPSDSHYACNKSRGVCTWACNSGFEVQGEVCSQTCTASADCKNAIPANSNRYCSGGFCSWRCKSGFTNTGNACVNPSTSTTTSRVASSSGALTTTSAAASSATCRVSSDCANVVPGNSNRYCNGGGCRSGYVANRRKLQEYNIDLGLHDDVDDVSAATLTAAATSPAATPTVLRSYEGATFFDRWNYLNKSDPTQGSVIYVSREFTEEKGLTYISPVGTAILQIDREPTLSPGDYRPSVRISSSDTYEPGHLILLDMKHAPHSPSVWPAFWMIDVYKGINERTFGQMSLYTTDGCARNPAFAQTGNMNGGNMRKSCSINDGSACSVHVRDPAGRVAGFNGECGGVFAVPYAETGISIWRWKRSDIPLDILIGVPRWTGWGTLVATWEGSMCDTRTYFKRQMLTFDITTCGTWAVSTSTWNNVASSGPVAAQYATCAQAVQDPAAFDEAYFEINYLPVYTV
ncbi:hypothetical protein JCM10449v2_004074 [Rhodotorula kratochvilovae]